MVKDKIAQAIRVLSVPPIMVSGLILILYTYKREYFSGLPDALTAFLLLGIIPVLAYPLQKAFPQYMPAGRQGQRKLAFITNLIGYCSAFIWVLVSHAKKGLLLLCATYFFSVVILSICNGMHFKASGHASSFTCPLLVLVYAFGWKPLIPCVLVSILIMWSSLRLKRHTLGQLIGGIWSCLLAFMAALIVINI